MQFRLTYTGKLKGGNSKNNEHIHYIRRQFHQQLKILWSQEPLISYRKKDRTENIIVDYINGSNFDSIIHCYPKLVCHLHILFMRPSLPGDLFRDGGDLDNRIKTLIDALRVPKDQEVPRSWVPENDEKPLHCLLHDDKFITGFSVETDRLLVADSHQQDVFIIVHVKVKAIVKTWNNTDLTD